MGIVWLSRDNQLERQVALKFLSEQIFHDHALLADLKRETKRSLELTHPNIVRIHDFVQDARNACISMEYVDGETLSNLRVNKANHIFEVPDLEPLVAQWCEAMHYAHTYARVVHCDLKPANLMLNVKGVLKITDFGIARSLSDSASRLTVTRSKSGTLVYMSPQQLNGDSPSLLDDVYSMGATLYELLTGKPPFYRGQIDRQIFDKTPPSITARRVELGMRSPYIVPLEWEETVAACLAKEPVDRPQSALAFLNRLNLVSPLRIEKPVVFPKIEKVSGAPPAPGEFGLMQDDTAVRSFVAREGQQDPPFKWPRGVKSSTEQDEARHGTPMPATPHLTTSNVDMTPSASDPAHKWKLRPGAALAGLGIIAIVALWYLLSVVSRPRSKSHRQTVSPNVVTRFVHEATPPIAAQPKPTAEPTPSPTVAPTISTEPVSPSPAANQTPLSSTVKEETPSPSKIPVESPAPEPKNEATKLRNELRASERLIISVHEKISAQERLEKMSPKARAEYERAMTAFQQGYLNTAEYSAVQADRIEPNQPLILNLLGLIFSSQQAFDKAEESFARSVTVDRNFLEGEYNLSSTVFKKKDYVRARKRFEHLASSITPGPNDSLGQLLKYRIYLALLLEGSLETAQNLMQQMQLGGDTPGFYYAHAAWEFRRGDAAIASQWLDSARAQYLPELNLVFAEPLSDVGWLNTDNTVRSSTSPTTSTSSPETSDGALSQIKALENKWVAAIPKHNAEDIGSLLAENYEAVTPTGRKLNRSEAINRIKNDTDNYESVVIKNLYVELESATRAVATGLLHQRGNAKNGKTFDRSYLFTDIWVKDSGRWLCVHSRTERANKR